MIKRQNLICLAIVLQGTLAKQRLWLTVDWLQTWNRICSHRDCETQRWIAKVQQRRSHGALRWTCRSQALEALGLSWKFLKAWSILEWIWRAVAIHSWGKVSQSLMYAEDLGFLFLHQASLQLCRQATEVTGKLGSNNQRHEDSRTGFCDVLRVFSITVLQYLLLWFVMRVCPTTCTDASSRAAKASICQMAPSKLGRQSPVLNMILLVWKTREHRKRRELGCWCFLVVWSALDSLWFTWSWIHYRKHSCISWVFAGNPELAIQPPKEFAQPAARSRKKP